LNGTAIKFADLISSEGPNEAKPLEAPPFSWVQVLSRPLHWQAWQ